MKSEFCIMSTRTSSWYAQQVVSQLLSFPDIYHRNLPLDLFKPLTPITFADGEIEVEVPQSVRGKSVFLISSSGRNSLGLTVADQKMELYHSLDAIRRSAAKQIILIEPYISSGRSDRTTRRNSVGFWVHYKTLDGLGVEHLLTYQLHSQKIKTAIDPCRTRVDDLPASNLLMDFFIDNPKLLGLNPVFCSVDAGGENLAKDYAKTFSKELIIAHKQRNYSLQNHVESTRILSDSPLENKEIWIVDDMIDTAGSVVTLCRELETRKVKNVNIAIIHPVFSEPAIQRLSQLHKDGLLQNLITTDTLEINDSIIEQLPFMKVVSTTRRTAEAILRIFDQESLSPFFDFPIVTP